jgi:spore maturation protein CgeB
MERKMRIVFFVHSIISDWNNGNAHFLRGIVSQLQMMGHQVVCYEPEDSWSLCNLRKNYGDEPIRQFYDMFPDIKLCQYQLSRINISDVLSNVDLVIVHEWNSPELVKKIGLFKKESKKFKLLFHDTHHRSASERGKIQEYDLTHFDGVLAFGGAVRHIYLDQGWTDNAWVWHEAADTGIFYPQKNENKDGDLVWIGNWGDGERADEINEFLIKPVKNLKLKAKVYGVRYPESALQTLSSVGIEYGGWLPNYRVPEIFSKYRVTIHIPRRPYVETLPGIPTIRVFEALACGIPLVCSPWNDIEQLFVKNNDYVIANNCSEMERMLERLLHEEQFGQSLAENGLNTILERHTCLHRCNELLNICKSIDQKKVLSTTGQF